MTNQEVKHISKVLNDSLKKGLDPIVNSLFHSGGTISPYSLKTYIEIYVNIGFCQPKFYKASSWSKALVIMKEGVKLGIVEPFDYGRGKGKYTTNLEFSEVSEKIFNHLTNNQYKY